MGSKHILVAVVLTLLTSPAFAVTQLFCVGESLEDDANAGEKHYLLVMDDEFAKYEIYEGMKDQAIMRGTLKKDLLFLHDHVMGEYQSIHRTFRLSRVTLQYSLGYTMRNGTFVKSSGTCERYQAKL